MFVKNFGKRTVISCLNCSQNSYEFGMRRHSRSHLSLWMHTEMPDTFTIVKQWTVHPIDHSFCAHCMIRCFHIALFCVVAIVWFQAWMLLNHSVTWNSDGVCCLFHTRRQVIIQTNRELSTLLSFHFHQLSCIRTAKYLYFSRFSVRKGCFVCDRVLMDF